MKVTDLFTDKEVYRPRKETPDIDEEIYKLELNQTVYQNVPGTILQRVLTKEGVGWTLGFGGMKDPKFYFTGNTIRECLEKAKKALSV